MHAAAGIRLGFRTPHSSSGPTPRRLGRARRGGSQREALGRLSLIHTVLVGWSAGPLPERCRGCSAVVEGPEERTPGKCLFSSWRLANAQLIPKINPNLSIAVGAEGLKMWLLS